MQQLKLRERELLEEVERVRSASTREAAALTIRVKECESRVLMMESQVEFERQEREYAEAVAAKESVMRAQMALEYENALQETRRYYKIV